MVIRERIMGACASIRRYSPLINLCILLTYPAIGLAAHFHLTHTIHMQSLRYSHERMELFRERDAMIVRLMEVRTSTTMGALEQLRRNTEKQDRAIGQLAEAAAKREEQLEMQREILAIIKRLFADGAQTPTP